MKVNALKIRQKFGEVLKLLQKNNGPIIVEKNHKPVAVLISFEDFQKRFIDYQEKKRRDEIIERMRISPTKTKYNTLDLLRSIRYAESN